MRPRLFYRLRQDAFDGSVDPANLALTQSEREALNVLEEGLASGVAILLLTGEPGLGKTTLARVLALRAEREGVRPVFVHHPRLDFDDLVTLIANDLNLPQRHGETPFERLQRLQGALVQGLERGRRVLVILDEAQQTPDATLENLRLLATLEAGAYARPLQILLVGQPELETRLRARKWRATAQRIGARAVLRPLSVAEARDFLGRRLAEAGPAVPQDVFTPGAIDAAVRAAGGVPRRLERIGHASLDAGAARTERPVRRATVRRQARRLEPLERKRRGPVPTWAPVLGGCAAVAAALVVVAGLHDRDHGVRLARAERHLAAAQSLIALRGADATAAPAGLRTELHAAAALDAPPLRGSPGTPLGSAAIAPDLRPTLR